MFLFIHTDANPHSPPKQSAESGGLELIPLFNASSRKERLESLKADVREVTNADRRSLAPVWLYCAFVYVHEVR